MQTLQENGLTILVADSGKKLRDTVTGKLCDFATCGQNAVSRFEEITLEQEEEMQ